MSSEFNIANNRASGLQAWCKKCKNSYQRGERKERGVAGSCSVDSCERGTWALGFCGAHYTRYRKGQSLVSAIRPKANKGEGYIRIDGYKLLKAKDGKHIREHRLIMAQVIGRPLELFENVHHKNGVTGDNRPENLELWTKPQPAGQRVKDLVDWVIENYLAEIEVALKEREEK